MNLDEKKSFQFFSGNTQSRRLHAALGAEHSTLSVRQLRTIWSQISFVCVARRIVNQTQQNEGASDQLGSSVTEVNMFRM